MRSAHEARERAGISFEEAARRLRVTHAYLRQAEGGSRPIAWGLLRRMSKIYKCSEFALVIRRLTPEPPTAKKKEPVNRPRDES